MKLIPMAEATEAELRTFAQETLGINIKASASLEQVRAKVETAWDRDIPVAEAAPKPTLAGDQPRPVTDEQGGPKPGKVRINIGIQEEAGGSAPVPVGVNGKIMLIPRGKDVDIPEAYLEALSHAITYKYEPMEDGLGMNPIPREVQLYPFQIIGRVDNLEGAQAQRAA